MITVATSLPSSAVCLLRARWVIARKIGALLIGLMTTKKMMKAVMKDSIMTWFLATKGKGVQSSLHG